MGRGYIKWSAEEEAAIRDGVAKHGVGKWQSILKDPEFSTVLVLRSNVDIKDKWRYIITKGESQIGSKPVPNNIKTTRRHYDKSAALTSEARDKVEFAQPEAPAMVHESLEDGDSDKLILRFDACIMDGRSNAKQPSSSAQIQEQIPPLNLKRSSWEDIRIVTADGKFNEHEMEYSLADSESAKEATIDAELMRSRQMRPEDAVAAAIAAIADAEESEKVAAEAERAAEEAQSVVEGLKRRLEEKKARSAPKRGKRGCSKH